MPFKHLEELMSMAKETVSDSATTCYLRDTFLAIWMLPFLEFYNIEMDNVFPNQ